MEDIIGLKTGKNYSLGDKELNKLMGKTFGSGPIKLKKLKLDAVFGDMKVFK